MNKIVQKILNALNEYIARNERWITIHPHGNVEDENGKKDYRRIKIEDGETPKEAIDRTFKKNNKKEISFPERRKKLEDEYSDLMRKRQAIQDEMTEKLNKFMKENPKYGYNKALFEFEKKYHDEVTAKREEQEKIYSQIIDKDNEISETNKKEAERLEALDVSKLDKDDLKSFVQDFSNINISRLDYSLRTKILQKNLSAKDRLQGFGYKETKKELSVINGVKKGKPMTHEEADNKHTNPNYKMGINDKGYSTNCQSCVVVYELRRRGFNIQTKAKEKFGLMQKLSEQPEIAFINPETGKTPTVNECNARNKEQALDWLEKNIQDGRYVFRVKWSGQAYGHIISAERIGNKLMLYDPQNNRTYDDKDKILNFLSDVGFKGRSYYTRPFLLRIDNLDIRQDYADAITEKL